VLAKEEETFKAHLADLKSRGFEKETREEIKSLKKERVDILEANISGQRSIYQANLPTMVQKLNAAIATPANKLSLR